MKPEKLLVRIQTARSNVRFSDLVRLIEAMGFVLLDIEGSHHLFEHRVHKRARLNIQNVRGEAKPYQVKQFLEKVEEYDLRIEDEQ